MPPLPALPLASAASPNPSCFPRPTSALAREIVPNPPPPPHIPAPPLTSGARRRGGSSVSVGEMSRRGKSVPQLGGGPEKRGGGSPAVPTPPAAPPQSQSAPPPPNGPWFPGCGGSSGQSSSSHGIQPGNPCEERPIGREAAKAECKGKRKAEQVMDGIVMLGYNISKIIEVTQERKKEREKMTEAQVEISRLNLEDCKGAKGGCTGAKRIKFARSL
ncbi:hypothetical protein GQ55_9G143100 [Panicum hallii var. hallii]|uniref:Uncharacterized protein n=1 Tax=Panicum hallii var. hallii TaxID=1504633 RepID=A0A2T7C2Z7_9POAL|nr:hypothetical protein GQ55_9G143100 [Panicum hallii var. hallii]